MLEEERKGQSGYVCVGYVKGRERDRMGVCKLCERKRDRGMVGGCVGFVKE